MIHARIFLSWSHADEALKDILVRMLVPQLRLSERKDLAFSWWEDSHIRIGEEWRREILSRIDEADYSLQLISPSFLTSDFIVTEEIPPFLGEQRGCLPVSLVHVPLSDPWIEWHGLNAKQVFSLNGKSFQQVRNANRQRFVAELAAQIRERVLRAHGKATAWTRA